MNTVQYSSISKLELFDVLSHLRDFVASTVPVDLQCDAPAVCVVVGREGDVAEVEVFKNDPVIGAGQQAFLFSARPKKAAVGIDDVSVIAIAAVEIAPKIGITAVASSGVQDIIAVTAVQRISTSPANQRIVTTRA